MIENPHDKICPFSLAGSEDVQCLTGECMGWKDGECFIERMSLSLYLIAKNLRDMEKRQADMVRELRKK